MLHYGSAITIRGGGFGCRNLSQGDAVIVSSASVPEPKAARYAWQANPVATLFNGAGLPAVPFRTDDWPGITEGHAPY